VHLDDLEVCMIVVCKGHYYCQERMLPVRTSAYHRTGFAYRIQYRYYLQSRPMALHGLLDRKPWTVIKRVGSEGELR
jgi:hypothetical protein